MEKANGVYSHAIGPFSLRRRFFKRIRHEAKNFYVTAKGEGFDETNPPEPGFRGAGHRLGIAAATF